MGNSIHPDNIPLGSSTPDESQALRGDKQENRLVAILGILQQSGTVSVDELRTKLDVSVVTIRRDLNLLEERGLLRRTHGGAESIEPLFYEPFRNDRSFQAQVSRFADEKRRIGRAAASMISGARRRGLGLRRERSATTFIVGTLPCCAAAALLR